MTILIQESGTVPLLSVEGRTGTVALWPAAVSALKARDQKEQQEWLMRNIEEFSKKDAARLRNWFVPADEAEPVRQVRT